MFRALWPTLPQAEGALLRTAAAVAALTVIVVALRRVYAAWMASVEERRRVMEAVAQVHAQLVPDHGASLRDAVDQIKDETRHQLQRHSEQLDILATELSALSRTVAALPRRTTDCPPEPKRRRWRRAR